MTHAITAALYFDHELAARPAPLVMLAESLLRNGDGYRQWRLDVDGRKTPPPSAFDLAKLTAWVRKGSTSTIGIETTPNTPEAEYLRLRIGTAPLAKRPERFTLTRCRYEAFVALGANRRVGLDAIIAFADAIAVRAGAIVVADTASFAMALATGAGGGTLDNAQVERITEGLYWRPHWGDVIRGPCWGTFLGAHHVERLGGLPKIERECGCARVIPLNSGGAYLQTTLLPSADVPAELVRFLEPVRRAATASG